MVYFFDFWGCKSRLLENQAARSFCVLWFQKSSHQSSALNIRKASMGSIESAFQLAPGIFSLFCGRNEVFQLFHTINDLKYFELSNTCIYFTIILFPHFIAKKEINSSPFSSVFNVGDYRRKAMHLFPGHDFFLTANREGTAVRNRVALDALQVRTLEFSLF